MIGRRFPSFILWMLGLTFVDLGSFVTSVLTIVLSPLSGYSNSAIRHINSDAIHESCVSYKLKSLSESKKYNTVLSCGSK